MAVKIAVNAKMRRTGICGSAETLLVDRAVAGTHLKPILTALSEAGCEIRGDKAVVSALPEAKPATEEDWSTEYLDAIISARLVDGVEGAIEHIGRFSSSHTEAIVAEDEAVPPGRRRFPPDLAANLNHDLRNRADADRLSRLLESERAQSRDERETTTRRHAAELEHGITSRLILCGIRNISPASSLEMAELVVGRHERIVDALKRFTGVKRRLEVVGAADEVTIYDDFAHHPTAVAETLAGLRAANPDRRIWAVFEPRSASSCRRVFQDDFARAFAPADEIVIAPVFRSTLPEAERLSVPRLVRDLNQRGQAARAADSIDDIIATVVREHRAGDVVVLMSNGGFGGIHRRLLDALGAARRGRA